MGYALASDSANYNGQRKVTVDGGFSSSSTPSDEASTLLCIGLGIPIAQAKVVNRGGGGEMIVVASTPHKDRARTAVDVMDFMYGSEPVGKKPPDDDHQ
jgi:hypothetical protein